MRMSKFHCDCLCLYDAGMRGQRAEDDEGECQQSQQHSAHSHPSDQSDGLGWHNKDFKGKSAVTGFVKADVCTFAILEDSRCAILFCSTSLREQSNHLLLSDNNLIIAVRPDWPCDCLRLTHRWLIVLLSSYFYWIPDKLTSLTCSVPRIWDV